jgi:hypothetical protein
VFRFALTVSLLLLPLLSQAQTSMQCERYQVKGGLKTERSFHRFEMDKTRSSLRYERVSGHPWIITHRSDLSVTWSSRDGLRVVAVLVAPLQQDDQPLQGPVYVADLDFGKPRVRIEAFGGAIDLDEVLNDPWKIECRRLN